jgi:hypothetical protein
MLNEMYILNQHGDTDAPNVEKNEQYVDFVEQSDDLDSVKKSKRYMCSVCFKLFSKEKHHTYIGWYCVLVFTSKMYIQYKWLTSSSSFGM